MPDTSVKIFHSAMTGAPTLSGSVGALIGVLDACLVNGWGTGTVDSIVIAGGVATVTRSAGHPFIPDSVAEIAGASVTGGNINGEQKVIAVTTTTYTFAASGVPNQTATGTITHKLASAGWTKPYSSTNIGVYRSADVTGTQMYLRVDDTGTTSARVRGYETMSDVNTGTGPFPLDSQISGGGYANKSGTASAATRRWYLFADGKTFYLINNWSVNDTTTAQNGCSLAFGDLLQPGTDSYRVFLHSFTSEGGTPGSADVKEFFYTGNGVTGTYAARSYSALGAPVALSRRRASFADGESSVALSGDTSGAHLMFPNPADGGLYVTPMLATQGSASSNRVYRGRYPGVLSVPQAVTNTVFTNLSTVTGVSGYAGRKLMAVNNSVGVQFVDVTGPWD